MMARGYAVNNWWLFGWWLELPRNIQQLPGVQPAIGSPPRWFGGYWLSSSDWMLLVDEPPSLHYHVSTCASYFV